MLGAASINLQSFFFFFFFVYSIILHEIAHAAAALAFGDRTAKDLGRITLNPIPHIDPLGSILLPALGAFRVLPICFGWARPVPVDVSRLKARPWGDIVVSLAGIATNLLVAFVAAVLLRVPGLAQPNRLGANVLAGVHVWNIWLALFNLLPIPPLDGSHVFKYLLPRPLAEQYERIGFAGIFIVMLLLWTRGVQEWLVKAEQTISDVFVRVASLPWPGA
ncbi:MAG: site-2 protease family protein [Planctomycetes bacterium]|nr:site-2 protease family protein [Planctomycetota bacterium]